MLSVPQRGEVWLAELDPTHHPMLVDEQAGLCPVVVVSSDLFNRGPAGLLLVLPLTCTKRNIPLHVPIDPPEGGVTSRSYILCESIRAISRERISPNPWGTLAPHTMRQVEDILRVLMNL